MRVRRTLTVTGICAVVAVGGGTAYAAVSSSVVGSSGVIHGCVSNRAVRGTHVLLVHDTTSNCPRGTTELDWNQRGAAGPAGPAGAKGDTGATGATGPAGAAGAAGAVGPAGPKGDTGATGAIGPAGATGPAGPAGTSTAGPSGLDVITVVATSTTGTTTAECPPSHPFAIGGGGTAYTDADAVAPLSATMPVGTPASGWMAVSAVGAPPDDNVSAYAECAK
jgi:hypothetical protein